MILQEFGSKFFCSSHVRLMINLLGGVTIYIAWIQNDDVLMNDERRLYNLTSENLIRIECKVKMLQEGVDWCGLVLTPQIKWSWKLCNFRLWAKLVMLDWNYYATWTLRLIYLICKHESKRFWLRDLSTHSSNIERIRIKFNWKVFWPYYATRMFKW